LASNIEVINNKNKNVEINVQCQDFLWRKLGFTDRHVYFTVYKRMAITAAQWKVYNVGD